MIVIDSLKLSLFSLMIMMMCSVFQIMKTCWRFRCGFLIIHTHAVLPYLVKFWWKPDILIVSNFQYLVRSAVGEKIYFQELYGLRLKFFDLSMIHFSSNMLLGCCLLTPDGLDLILTIFWEFKINHLTSFSRILLREFWRARCEIFILHLDPWPKGSKLSGGWSLKKFNYWRTAVTVS